MVLFTWFQESSVFWARSLCQDCLFEDFYLQSTRTSGFKAQTDVQVHKVHSIIVQVINRVPIQKKSVKHNKIYVMCSIDITNLNRYFLYNFPNILASFWQHSSSKSGVSHLENKLAFIYSQLRNVLSHRNVGGRINQNFYMYLKSVYQTWNPGGKFSVQSSQFPEWADECRGRDLGRW